MTKPTPEIILVPLDQLYLHEMNPRQDATEDQIEAKAASMATSVGLMVNLLAFDDPEREGFGIVGGGLRLRGLQKLAAEGWARHADQVRIDPVPVQVTGDPMTARAWALGENVSREELSPVQEMRAYRAMAETGATAEIIARAFGKPARHVARRLALAQLPAAAQDALEAGKISLDVARTLTLARSETQFDDALQAAIRDGLNEWQLRRMLTTDSVASDDPRALCVGLTAYSQAGGTMTEDLFADQHQLHDPDILQRLFEERLKTFAATVAEEGWAEVREVSDQHWVDMRQTERLERIYADEIELPEADMETLAELEEIGLEWLDNEGQAKLHELRDRMRGDFTEEDRARGIVFVYADRSGTLHADRAWAKPATRTRGGGDTAHATETPAIPQAVRDDLRGLEQAALMGALADQSELVLDLLAYQLSMRCAPWRGLFALSAEFQTLPDASDTRLIDARIAEVETGLNHSEAPDWTGFEAFREKGKKHRNQVLARVLPRAINSLTSGGFVKDVAQQLSPGLRKVWTPTAADFFGRCRADYLETIWAQLLDLDPDDARRAEFAALKKGEKAKALEALFNDASAQEAHGLSRDQITKIDTWLPTGMTQGEDHAQPH